MMQHKGIAKVNGWEIHEPEAIFRTKVFSLCKQRVHVEKRQLDADYYLLESVDWVNVIPLTPQQEVVFIRQMRPAVRTTCLEIPGGMCDETDADPAAGAARELEEETGYRAGRIESLGSVSPNPAICCNSCHFFVARDVRPDGQQQLEPGEDVSIELIPLKEVPRLISSGAIIHSLVLNAFLKLFILQGIPS
jgi:ADP-ribose pyrophosphatase